MEGRKSAISVRIGAVDLRKLKAIARRLGVRDSDVFRYAVKCSLAQLGPLEDASIQGRQLLPVFVEAGPELVRFFELDAARLGEIVNAGVEDPELLVATQDLTLLAMAGMQESYAFMRLGELLEDVTGMPLEKGSLLALLRDYLYDKYVFRHSRRLAVA